MNDDTIQVLLRELGLRPTKGRGQSFLRSAVVASNLTDAAMIRSTDHVLEIGAGVGAMTEQILERTHNITIVEVEQKCCEYLRKRFVALDPERIICADVRTLDPELLKLPNGTVLVSNVPYSISTDFIRWFFQHIRSFNRAALLLQREFAERLAATPGNRAYGSLTVYRERFASVELGEIIDGSEFVPPVKVQSRAIVLRPRVVPEDERPHDEQVFEKLVEAAFSHKRKTLVNSLFLAGAIADKAVAASILRDLGLSEQSRAEELGLKQFVALEKRLSCPS